MRRNKGFTLVELLVVVALIAVAASLMYTFFGQGLSLYTAESKSADEQANMRLVLSDITNRARLTDSADISCSNNVLTVGDAVYRRSGEQILRNDGVIANGILSFTAAISDSILDIRIESVAGTKLETSLSLKQ
jgi:prepilin-type N-terminal cleavage/methylation domain-containing protein